MSKLKLTSLLSALGIFLSIFTTPSIAGKFGMGVSGQFGALFVDGEEILKQDANDSTGPAVTKKEINNQFWVPSIYMEYNFKGEGNQFDGFVLGLEHIPVTAEMKGEQQNLTKTKLNEGANEHTSSTVTQKAQAQISHHTTVYVETPGVLGGFYAKVGGIYAYAESEEDLSTGASYGNDWIAGVQGGLGFKRYLGENFLVKLEGNYTNYETINLKSYGSDGSSTITADTEVYGAKLSLGYSF